MTLKVLPGPGVSMFSGNPLVLCLAFVLLSTNAWPQQKAGAPHRFRTPSYTETGADSCLRCHSGESIRAVQSSPHSNVRKADAPSAAHYCESCHGRGSIHISRAHGGRGFPPLTEFGNNTGAAPRSEQLAACLACHGSEGNGPGVGFIGSPHDRPAINCSTCHTVHTAVDPMRDPGQQVAVCERCHGRQLPRHAAFDALPCSSCHDPHAITEAAQ